jgi:hypothetical protein
LAPSTISVGSRRLADAGLIDHLGAALLPELFWELSEIWRPARRWLLGVPKDTAGWRSGSAVAAAYGAPVVTADDTVELYLRSEVEVAAMLRLHGAAETGLGNAVISAAPTPLMCVDASLEVGGWPAAPPLVVALDLAQDRARGREILADWSHPDAVWR